MTRDQVSGLGLYGRGTPKAVVGRDYLVPLRLDGLVRRNFVTSGGRSWTSRVRWSSHDDFGAVGGASVTGDGPGRAPDTTLGGVRGWEGSLGRPVPDPTRPRASVGGTVELRTLGESSVDPGRGTIVHLPS